MKNVKYIPKTADVTVTKFGTTTTKSMTVIYQQYTTDDGIEIRIPSRLSSLMYKWENQSISNSRNFADIICPFINFVYQQTIDGEDEKFDALKEKGLMGLTYYHAQQYLIYKIGQGINRSTATAYTSAILDFYTNLLDIGILDKKLVKRPKTRRLKKGKRKGQEMRIENPFKKYPYEVPYPTKTNTKLNKLINLDEDVWLLFLRVAETYAPDIVLGIALQMFGGLRRGEVVNLTLEDIKPVGENPHELRVDIYNRTTDLFNGRKDAELVKSQPKKPRANQVIVNFNGELIKYYNNHLDFRTNRLATTKSTTDALFVDKYGRPMSGLRYEQRWNKVKREFLKALENTKYSESKEYTKKVWGCHLGRGIFTNLCLVYGLASNADQLRNLRGDESSDSSKPYIDEFFKSGLVVKALNYISTIRSNSEERSA